jgi:hypothetical protein
LEDLWATNVHIQEENEILNEQVQMFNKRMAEMEKHLETSSKMFSFLKMKFEECQDSRIVVMTYWDKHIVQLAHLGEKVI